MSEFAMMLLMNSFSCTPAHNGSPSSGRRADFEDFDFDPGNLIPHDVIPPMPNGDPSASR